MSRSHWSRLGYCLVLTGCCAAGGLLGSTPPARAATTVAGYWLFPQYNVANRGSLFDVPHSYDPLPSERLRQDVWLRYQQGGFNSLVTMRNVLESHRSPDYRLIPNEIFYDFSLGALDFSAGRKVLGWGVGEAFRPLDVLQREDRRRLIVDYLEGMPEISVERFLADGSALSLIYAYRLQFDSEQVTSGRHETALRYYRTFGETDVMALAHWSEQEHLAVGAGFAHVVNDAVEAHASFLYRQDCLRLLNGLIDSGGLLATGNPFKPRDTGGCGKLAIGASWTGESGYSLLFEAWHDGEAHTVAEFRDQAQLARHQRALSILPGNLKSAVALNLAADQQFFAAPILLQNNLFLRAAHDGENLDPSLEILVTPEDGGIVATGRLDYTITDHTTLVSAIRGFTGPKGSAYREMPDVFVAMLGLKLAF